MLCIGRGPSQFCETSANIANWVADPFRWFCELLGKDCGKRKGILTSHLVIFGSGYMKSEDLSLYSTGICLCVG